MLLAQHEEEEQADRAFDEHLERADTLLRNLVSEGVEEGT